MIPLTKITLIYIIILMNELLPEYPKKDLNVLCYCPTNQWNARKIPNKILCKRCESWREFFEKQYADLAAKL